MQTFQKLTLAMLGLAAVVAVAGCSPGVDSVTKSEFDTSKLSYFHDARSNTCYAAVKTSKGRMDWFGTDDRVIFTSVPCTAEVMALVGKS